jgi:hypothetical protein
MQIECANGTVSQLLANAYGHRTGLVIRNDLERWLALEPPTYVCNTSEHLVFDMADSKCALIREAIATVCTLLRGML